MNMRTPEISPEGERYVWVLANSFTRWLWKDFAHWLAKETKLKPILIVGTEADKKFYQAQYSEPVNFEIIVQKNPYEYAVETNLDDAEARDIAARAKAIETKYGFTLQRHCLLADRNLGRGYMPAGAGHPRSRFADIRTLDSALKGCVEVFDQAADWFEQYPPALVVCYYGGGWINGKAITLPCREKNIPFRAFCPSRFGQLAYWAEDEYEGNSRLRAFLSQPSEQLSDTDIKALRADIKPSGLSTDKTQLRLIYRLTSLFSVSKAAAINAVTILYGRFRGYFKSRYGNTILSTTRYMFRARQHWKLLNRIAAKELPPTNGRKLVYLPLQQEPEQATLILSPDHSNQLATVLEVALSLPADAMLVVKEHIWQLGRRPKHFYQTLLDTPNVRLLHPLASSIDTMMASDLVCTISSSAGYEATALGKKTVFFWKQCPLQDVPHVNVIEGFSGMDLIAQLLDEEDETLETQRQNDGALFYKRLQEFCFDVGEIDFYGRKVRPDEKALGLLGQTLLASLPKP